MTRGRPMKTRVAAPTIEEIASVTVKNTTGLYWINVPRRDDQRQTFKARGFLRDYSDNEANFFSEEAGNVSIGRLRVGYDEAGKRYVGESGPSPQRPKGAVGTVIWVPMPIDEQFKKVETEGGIANA